MKTEFENVIKTEIYDKWFGKLKDSQAVAPKGLSVWDPADYIKTPEDVFAHIEVAIEENDPLFLQKTLNCIARSKGMATLTAESGVTIDDIRKTLTSKGFSSFVGMLSSKGFQLAIKPKDATISTKPKRVRAVSKKSRTATSRGRITSGKRTAKAKA